MMSENDSAKILTQNVSRMDPDQSMHLSYGHHGRTGATSKAFTQSPVAGQVCRFYSPEEMKSRWTSENEQHNFVDSARAEGDINGARSSPPIVENNLERQTSFENAVMLHNQMVQNLSGKEAGIHGDAGNEAHLHMSNQVDENHVGNGFGYPIHLNGYPTGNHGNDGEVSDMLGDKGKDSVGFPYEKVNTESPFSEENSDYNSESDSISDDDSETAERSNINSLIQNLDNEMDVSQDGSEMKEDLEDSFEEHNRLKIDENSESQPEKNPLQSEAGVPDTIPVPPKRDGTSRRKAISPTHTAYLNSDPTRIVLKIKQEKPENLNKERKYMDSSEIVDPKDPEADERDSSNLSKQESVSALDAANKNGAHNRNDEEGADACSDQPDNSGSNQGEQGSGVSIARFQALETRKRKSKPMKMNKLLEKITQNALQRQQDDENKNDPSDIETKMENDTEEALGRGKRTRSHKRSIDYVEYDDYEIDEDEEYDGGDGDDGIVQKPLHSKLYTSTPNKVPKLDTEPLKSVKKESVSPPNNSSEDNMPLTTNRYRRHFLKQMRKTEVHKVAPSVDETREKSNMEIWEEDDTSGEEDSLQIDDSYYNSDEEKRNLLIDEDNRVRVEDIDEMATHKCRVCLKEFETVGTLMVHYICHSSAEKECVARTIEASYGYNQGKRMNIDLPYSCSFCGKSYRSPGLLSLHEREHKQALKSLKSMKSFTCDICANSFPTAESLHIHRREHNGEQPHACEICGKCFRDKTRLTTHMRTHTGEKPFPCPLCDKRFSQKGNMQLHLKTHTGEKACKCVLCGHSFRHNHDLIRHWKSHSGDDMFTCPVCKMKFEDKDKIEEHLTSHAIMLKEQAVKKEMMIAAAMQQAVGKSMAPSMGPKSEEAGGLNSVSPDSSAAGIGQLSSSMIDTIASNLSNSFANAALGNFSFPSNFGMTQFPATLGTSPNFPQGVKKMYRCEECSIDFINFPEFQRHLKSHKESQHPRVPCTICGKEMSGNNMADHMRTHTGEKPYTCIYCGKLFRRSHHLQTHLRTHTGDKPYRCEICDKSFARGDHLQNHRRTHTGEKPYTCDLCGKSYSQSHHLLRHKRTHTGEKPYKCQLCEKAFSRDHHLKKHMETHKVVIFREAGDLADGTKITDRLTTELSLPNPPNLYSESLNSDNSNMSEQPSTDLDDTSKLSENPDSSLNISNAIFGKKIEHAFKSRLLAEFAGYGKSFTDGDESFADQKEDVNENEAGVQSEAAGEREARNESEAGNESESRHESEEREFSVSNLTTDQNYAEIKTERSVDDMY